MGDVTELLKSAVRGEPGSAEQLIPLVYHELRELARRRLAREQPGHTLQPTALVHEAFMRLAGGAGADRQWEGRAHFFAAAAEAMRRILIDAARRRGRAKRGGDAERADLDPDAIAAPEPPEQLLAVNEALARLAAADPPAAQLVKLRYFVGFTVSEAAEAMGLPLRSAERLWAYAKAWLHDDLGGH